VRFFNIDLHVAVIEDIMTMFRESGHTVDSHNLSGHMWTIGKTQSQGYGPVHLRNWERCLRSRTIAWRFYTRNLLDYDGFVVTHLAAMSRLYARYRIPVIVNLSTRYEFPFTARPRRWRGLNKYLVERTRDGLAHLVANSLYDQAYFEYFTGVRPCYIPSICSYIDRYAGSKYAPEYDEALIFGDQAAGVECSRKVPAAVWVRQRLPRHEHRDLVRFKAHVNVPYNASVMSFFERYWLNVPQFVPSQDLLLRLHRDGKALQQLSWMKVLNGSPLPRVGTDLPDPNHADHLKAWMPLYDFFTFPHITYFDSYEDLADKLRSADLPRISQQMGLANAGRKDEASRAWKRIADAVASYSYRA
jgi:hypothetical protein